MLPPITNVRCDKIEDPILQGAGVELFLQREDLIDQTISGNKYRKLRHNLIAFQESKKENILTFGGAHSNHIAAVAGAGKQFNIPTIGYIRGELIQSPTLTKAKRDGMHLIPLERQTYRRYSQNPPDAFLNRHADSFILPEGGANQLGVLGCTEILSNHDEYDLVCSAVGTGGTLSGIISSLKEHQKAMGVVVLKGEDTLSETIQENLAVLGCRAKNWDLQFQYHLGGYAKNNQKLIQFIQEFYTKHKIKLDPIYTGKLLYAIFDLCEKKVINNCKTLAIHTGGLQGVTAFENRYKKKLFG